MKSRQSLPFIFLTLGDFLFDNSITISYLQYQQRPDQMKGKGVLILENYG